MKPGKELIFLPLGGSGEIGMNVNLYGCNGKWVMVDLGMTFADPSYPGVELVLPDLSFIEDRAKDLLGIVLTHGHEDHIGAIPYLANDLGVPLYATPFTAGLIAKKLEEEGIAKDVKLHIIPMGGTLQLGDFGFRYVALAHSIPEGNALIIDTPYGRIFHTGDWKLDDGPLLGTPGDGGGTDRHRRRRRAGADRRFDQCLQHRSLGQRNRCARGPAEGRQGAQEGPGGRDHLCVERGAAGDAGLCGQGKRARTWCWPGARWTASPRWRRRPAI